MSWEFHWPWVFLLLPLPLLARYLLPRAEEAKPAALRFPFFGALKSGLTLQEQRHAKKWKLLAILAWLLLVVAAARPQLIGESIEMPVTGRSLMMAVDISGSMLTEDMNIRGRPITRLAAVKAVAGEFIERRKGDRIGLILFGTQAYLQAPLTFDRKTVTTLLNEAQMGLAGQQTAIGDAIGLAVKRLQQQPEKNRVLILLTDVANTAGHVDPLKAADLAAAENIRIYTIGIGSKSQMIRTPFGIQQVGGSDLDEPLMKAIAQKTGGEYFRATDLQSLQRIYTLLDEIEALSEDTLSYRPVDELYQWPLAFALLLTMILAVGKAGLLSAYRFKRVKTDG
jgi:Ca-activated chloride channel family protein